MTFRTFSDAKTFVHSLNLQGLNEWRKYCKSGKKPDDIPSAPDKQYKDKGWINLGDWLGTNTVAPINIKFRPFNEAREYVHSLNLHDVKEWEKYCKSGKKPNDIPSHADRSYKNKGLISFGDWLGTNTVADRNRKYRPFNEAREFVRSLNLPSVKEWEKYCKSGKKPDDIPYKAYRSYKNKGWTNWGDWLGTNFIATRSRKYRPFNEAQEFAHSLNLSDANAWREYCNSDKKPDDIPRHPYLSYKNKGWTNWGDWLGTGTLSTQETGWTIKKVKELLRSMIESRVIYDWSEARLYKFLLTKGVLNLGNMNKHRNFFNNLIKAVKTEEGRKIVEDYAFSQSNDTPDLSNLSQEDNDDEILVASTEELSKLVNDNFDPFDYKEPPTVEQVLSSSSLLESINVDEEAMKFFLRGAIINLTLSF